jgi:glutathionylspermidine amidase/synthetase
MLIWNEGGDYELTGHVAIVTQIADGFVRVVEQNVEHTVWEHGKPWSRELPASLDQDGRYWVDCTFKDASILGWVIQTTDDTDAVDTSIADPALFEIKARKAKTSKSGWLDRADPAQAAFAESMNGDRLATHDEDLTRYFEMSETARLELRRVTNQLHAMFLYATGYVLEHPEILAKFNFPEALIARIQASWNNRRTHAITGRMDFAVRPEGIKIYEYNIDSASCHYECGFVQGRWAQVHGAAHGRDPGANLHEGLTRAWISSHIDAVVHILRDDDIEETYHALYMQSAIEAAGLRCKIIVGLDGLGWDENGAVVDADGEPIVWVWKTWAWETALDQLRDEAVDEDAFLAAHTVKEARDHDPRLIDVLLRPETMVFEPLWTLIPSNKAILPVLWMLSENHPNLLEASFELTDSLKEKGYVTKPIVGRCGQNITLRSPDDEVLAETGGKFDAGNCVYQALFKLPNIDGYRVQVSTFTSDGHDAGACLRCDKSLVVTTESDIFPLRIVPDQEL